MAASTGTVGQLLSTQSSAPPIQVWTVNTGTATFTNASSFHRVQFTTSDAGSVGNLLDAIQLTLRPFVQISTANSAALESSGAAGLATLLVTGASASPISVTVVRGTEYKTPGGGASFTRTVPAGTYNNTAVPLGITIATTRTVIWP